MKNLLNKRINNIQSLEERKLFRDIVSEVFCELADYQERQVAEIKRSFYNEMTLDHNRPVIHGTIISRYEYDETDNFMYPMTVKDLEQVMPTGEEICKTISSGKTYMLGKTFLKCDHNALERLVTSGRNFKGKIYTTDGVKDITVKLAKYRGYDEIINHLYSVFIKNSMEWTPVCFPYINKFVAFMIENVQGITKDTIIERIEVDLEEFTEYREDNVFPVWNLEYTNVQSVNFPIPVYDNVMNEHRFDVYDLPSYCYIPDFAYEYNGYVKRKEESISIIIPEVEISSWPMYKLHPAVSDRKYIYNHQIYSNGSAENFNNGCLNVRQKAIRTKGELLRLMSSYKVSEMFRINDCQVFEDGYDENVSTYSINHDICDELRTSEGLKKTLVIYYENKYEEDYLTSDIVSFLIANVQQYIPDMRCVGVVGRGAN